MRKPSFATTTNATPLGRRHSFLFRLEDFEDLMCLSAQDSKAEGDERLGCNPLAPQRQVFDPRIPSRRGLIRARVLTHDHDDTWPRHGHEQVEVLAPADAQPVGILLPEVIYKQP